MRIKFLLIIATIIGLLEIFFSIYKAIYLFPPQEVQIPEQVPLEVPEEFPKNKTCPALVRYFHSSYKQWIAEGKAFYDVDLYGFVKPIKITDYSKGNDRFAGMYYECDDGFLTQSTAGQTVKCSNVKITALVKQRGRIHIWVEYAYIDWQHPEINEISNLDLFTTNAFSTSPVCIKYWK